MAIQKVKEQKVRKTAKKHKKPKFHVVHDKMDVDIESQKEPITIGLVHSNNCGHCLAMKPDWDSMKSRVETDESLKNAVQFMEIEKNDHNYDEKLSQINSDLVECSPIVVNGYPTMFCKRQQYVKQYGGGRSADDLTEWVKNAALKGQLGGRSRHQRSRHQRSRHQRSRQKKSIFSFLHNLIFTPSK
jgi:hypothetical protein